MYIYIHNHIYIYFVFKFMQICKYCYTSLCWHIKDDYFHHANWLLTFSLARSDMISYHSKQIQRNQPHSVTVREDLYSVGVSLHCSFCSILLSSVSSSRFRDAYDLEWPSTLAHTAYRSQPEWGPYLHLKFPMVPDPIISHPYLPREI